MKKQTQKQPEIDRNERRRRQRSGEADAERMSWLARREERREERGTGKYTLTDCMKMGRLANILFIVFIIVSVLYYYTLGKKGKAFIPFEVFAFSIEATAFVLFAVCAVWLDRLVRARGIMKGLLIAYIAVEVGLMLLEFGVFPSIQYVGLSMPLIILHVLFSAGVSLSLLMLDPQNKRLQTIVIITTVIILAGMLTHAAGYRVYASILVNAFAYIFFFTAMLRNLALDELDIDCYGDQARVSEIPSTMFADTPTMIEMPDDGPMTPKKKLKRIIHKLTPTDEKIVLTDEHEKFEYEFGVEEVDDDEYDDVYDDEYDDEYDDDFDDADDDSAEDDEDGEDA